jgi:hypothetical protein
MTAPEAAGQRQVTTYPRNAYALPSPCPECGRPKYRDAPRCVGCANRRKAILRRPPGS